MPEFEVGAKYAGPSTPDAAATAFELRLTFPPTRTRFLDVRVVQPDAFAPTDWWAPASVLVWLGWEQPLQPGVELRIVLEYDGETPPMPDVEFSGDSPVRKELVESKRLLVDQESVRLLKDFADSRQHEIDATEDATLQSLMAFFRDYDMATNPNFLDDKPELKTEIRIAQELLVARVISRVNDVNGQPSASIPAAPLEHLSNLQLDLFRHHFRTQGSGIDVRRFDDAFLAFSTGQLVPKTFDKWNARPDSAYFFLFAEFAINAIERGESADDWRALLPTFVRCQDLYITVFAPFCHPASQPRKYVRKEWRRFRTYTKQKSETPLNIDDVIRRVRQRYRDLGSDFDTLRRRHAVNAHDAFPRAEGQPHLPCEVISAETKQSKEEEGSMASDESLKRILGAITEYVATFITSQPREDETNDKFVLVDPVTLPATSEVFTTRPKAEEAQKKTPEDDHVLGPIAAILDVSTGEGWDGTPFHQLHIANQDLTIVGERDNKPFWWSFPNSKYNTFVIIVPK